MLENLKQWDRDLFVFFNNIGIEKYDDFWIFITQVSSWTPLYILFVVLIIYYYRRPKAQTVLFYLALVLIFTVSITGVVKEYVARLRPGEVEALAELIRVLQKPSRYSFFSGHASFSFSMTTFVVLALRRYTKWIYLSFLWPVLFILSRLYVGVHYPSDLSVGAGVGIIIASAGYLQCRKVLRRKDLKHSGNTKPITNGQ